MLCAEPVQTKQELAIPESASAISVASFANHVERYRSENNQNLIDEYQVTLCMYDVS